MGENGAAPDSIIAMLKDAEFPRGRRHRAYDARDVDEFLDRLVDACREGRAAPAMIDRAEFGPAPRRGDRYDERAVDVLLDDVRNKLESGSATPCPESLHRRPIWRSQDGTGLPRDEIIAMIKGAEFRRGRRHRAYDARDVDGFLDRLVDACREGRATPAMIDRAEFGPAPRIGDRYDERAVDVLLDDVRNKLESGSATPCPESLHRRPIWRSQDGSGLPCDALLAAFAAHDPRDALLIGCPDDGLALDLEPWITRGAVDVLDPWTGHGVVTIDRPDASLDLVCAPWTLYLATDVDRLLGEIARTLRPQGALLATADGRDHLAQLAALTGRAPARLAFDTETGPTLLRRHFGTVEQVDFATWATPRTDAEAQDLLAWQSAAAAAALPDSAAARDYAGHTSLLIATPTA